LPADFKKILGVRFFAAFAVTMQAVLVGWRIYSLKPDAIYLGMIGLTEAVPALGLSLLAGTFIDSHRPVRIIFVSLWILFFDFLLLAASVWFADHLSVFHQLTILFAAVFVSGSVRSFISPSIFSLLPHILDRGSFAKASAWRSSTYQIAAVSGPALGGLIYGFVSAEMAFAVLPLLMALSLICVLALPKKLWLIKNHLEHKSVLKNLREGWDFVFRTKPLLGAMTVDMFSVLFGGVTAVLPIFADQVFHVGATGLGMMRAAPAVGSGIVALSLGVRPQHSTSGRRLLLVVAGFGLCTLGFAATSNIYFATLCLFGLGVFDGVSVVIRDTLSQLLAPPHMRGRIASLESMFITSSNEIGAFESGIAAQFMGLIPSVIFGGVMTLIVAGACWVLIPELVKTEIKN
jgi:MFS family permease